MLEDQRNCQRPGHDVGEPTQYGTPAADVCACARRPASLPGVQARRSPLDATPPIDPAATVLQLVATLALTFVIGLEREERVARDRTLVGGVRTIPIIGLLGHAMALLSRASALPLAAGFLALAALLAVEYHHRLMQHPQGATSERGQNVVSGGEDARTEALRERARSSD